MRLVVIAVAVGSAIASGAASAEDFDWASHLVPAPAGVVELIGGAGVGYAPALTPGLPIAPALVLGARWGITDNIQLAFPLLATASARLPVLLEPRVSLTAGVAGAGYSTVDGVLFVPAIAGSVAFVGTSSALTLTVDGSVLAGGVEVLQTHLGGTAGFAFRLDQRWSVGFSAHASSSATTLGTSAIHSLRAGMGSSGGSVPADVPTVRFILSDAISTELWAHADFLSVDKGYTGAEDIGVNATITWRVIH